MLSGCQSGAGVCDGISAGGAGESRSYVLGARLVYNLLKGILGAGFVMEVASLGGAIIVGALIYAALILILKVDEVSIITNMVKSKLKRS